MLSDMAPLPTIPNVYRVTWNWNFSGGQTAANVLNFHDNTAGTHNEDDLFASMDGSADSVMFYGVADGASVTTIDIIKLDGTSPQKTYSSLTTANWDGGTGGQPIPAVAGLVSLRTARRGPRGRGRIFMPFWAEAEANAGFWADAGHKATCQAAWEEFIEDLHAADFDLQVTSYQHGTTEDVTSITLPLALATQRRRQRRLQ